MFPTRSWRSSVAEGTSPPRATRLRSKSPFYNCDNNLQPYHQHREESRGEQSSKAISFKEEETREEARGREVVLGGSRGGVGVGGETNASGGRRRRLRRALESPTSLPRRPHRKSDVGTASRFLPRIGSRHTAFALRGVSGRHSRCRLATCVSP